MKKTTFKITLHYAHPPIPDRNFDWVAFEDGKEEDGDYGMGTSPGSAVAALFELLEEKSSEAMSDEKIEELEAQKGETL